MPCTDALDNRRFEERPSIASIGDRVFSARTPRWRLVWNPHANKTGGSSSIPEASLFDEEVDPRELRDVSAENPRVVEDLEAAIRAWRTSRATPAERAARSAAGAPAQ